MIHDRAKEHGEKQRTGTSVTGETRGHSLLCEDTASQRKSVSGHPHQDPTLHLGLELLRLHDRET